VGEDVVVRVPENKFGRIAWLGQDSEGGYAASGGCGSQEESSACELAHRRPFSLNLISLFSAAVAAANSGMRSFSEYEASIKPLLAVYAMLRTGS
jgi:hypothetical protein